MGLAICLFLACYALIASEKVDKTIVALVGGGLAVALHLIPCDEALAKVDLNVVFLLIGMMVIVSILADTGVFEWLAIQTARRARNSGMLVCLMFMVLTGVVSALLDNVTTVILVAPLTILVAEILEIAAVPILIMEAVFSNVGGASTLVGDPPNIIIGMSTGLGFNQFLVNLGPIVLVLMAASLGVTWWQMRHSTKVPAGSWERIRRARPEKAITDAFRLKRALIVFVGVLLGFFLGRPLGVEPGIVALIGAFVMAQWCKVDLHKTIARIEWGTILFFVGLFMLVGMLEYNGVVDAAGDFLLKHSGGNMTTTLMAILWGSAIASAVIDNIPLVMAMIPLVKGIIPAMALHMGIQNSPELVHTHVAMPLFWALALGACLGGNGSLVGASANVIVAQIARRNNYKLTFWGFTRASLPHMLLHLSLCSAYLWFRFRSAA